jgi:hypothetical protein
MGWGDRLKKCTIMHFFRRKTQRVHYSALFGDGKRWKRGESALNAETLRRGGRKNTETKADPSELGMTPSAGRRGVLKNWWTEMLIKCRMFVEKLARVFCFLGDTDSRLIGSGTFVFCVGCFCFEVRWMFFPERSP